MGTVLGLIAACYTIGGIVVFKIYRRDPKAGGNWLLCLTAAVLWLPLILIVLILGAIVEIDRRAQYRNLVNRSNIPSQHE